jgi:homoserine O-acetyltransferase/O-succinyltransferase
LHECKGFKRSNEQREGGVTLSVASNGGEVDWLARDSRRPEPNDAFVELHDFVFGNGETLASLKLHYLTLGTPRRNASGAIADGVLLLHGTAGSAADLAQAAFFDALYGAGEPLDLSRYFLVIPDAIGAGESSKPSDGLRANFPHYGYKIRFGLSIYCWRR